MRDIERRHSVKKCVEPRYKNLPQLRRAKNNQNDDAIVHWVNITFEYERLSGELLVSPESTGVAIHPADALPANTMPGHLIRINDALARSPTPFIR